MAEVYRKVGELLNSNPKMADTMDLEQLESLLRTAEEAYYNADFESFLDDKVYDYAKSAYERRAGAAGDDLELDLEHVPEPPVGSKVVKSPYWMGSMDKMLHGDGGVASWAKKFAGPYLVTAKMDGMSALLFTDKATGKRQLITRGRTLTSSQDISNLLSYLTLPDTDPSGADAIRGELIIKKSVFEEKYKERYRNGRNAVAGITRHFATNDKIDKSYLDIARDLDFVTYELITHGSSKLPKESEQLARLSDAGFQVVENLELSESELTEDTLSDIYDAFLEDIDYEIDGLVIYSDHQYQRNKSGNPEYARAYKKPLERQIGKTVVRKVEWNLTRYKYFKPLIYIDPIDVDGVTISKVTGHNAKYLFDNKIGRGAVLKVIRSGGVIPKVHEVISHGEPVEYPTLPYRWNDTHVDLLLNEEADHETTVSRGVEVKKLAYFLSSIDAKGVGEATVGKIYDLGFTTIDSLLRLKVSDLKSLGAKTAENTVKSIQGALKDLTLPVLMTASGAFGRGIGSRKFAKILERYPDLLGSEAILTGKTAEIIDMISKVEGFAKTTAKVVADGMPKFLEMFTKIPEDISMQVMYTTEESDRSTTKAEADAAVSPLYGQNICFTGFRDKELQKKIENSGGKVQTAVSGTTNILVIKDSSYSNKKTESAAARGIPVLTREQFMTKYS